jgi:hypothetical protein
VLGVELVVTVVVVVVVVLAVEVAGVLELELVLLLGVDELAGVEALDDPLAGEDECDAEEVDVLELAPLASAYATAPPSRSSATTARTAHGPAPRERLGGTASVGAAGSGGGSGGGGGGGAAACGTVAICGTSAAAAAAAIIASAAGSGLVGAVAVSKLASRSRTSAAVWGRSLGFLASI